MKTFFTIVWYLIRIVLAISRFLLMKLVLGPLLHLVRPFFAAVRYLTILPVPKWLGGGAKDLRRSLVHFRWLATLLLFLRSSSGAAATSRCYRPRPLLVCMELGCRHTVQKNKHNIYKCNVCIYMHVYMAVCILL